MSEMTEWIIAIFLLPVIWNIFFKDHFKGMDIQARLRQTSRANATNDLNQRQRMAKMANCYYDPVTHHVDYNRKYDGSYHL